MAASNTVIIGAGIIGCSTAYFLAKSSNTPAKNIHLIESSEQLFNCASGYAGGFLAKDWFSPSVTPLGELSFKLHQELAIEHDGRAKWGYSPTTTSSLSQDSESAVDGSGEDWLRHHSSRANAAASISRESQEELPKWINLAEGSNLEIISSHQTTAQVDPLRLSRFLLSECKSLGVNLHHPARAVSVSKDVRDTLSSVRIIDENNAETDIPCTRIIITAGAWTPKVFETLFPSSQWHIPVSSLAGHSLLLKSPRWVETMEEKGCHAVFATDSGGFSPEIFARLGGELYIAGLNSTILRLPDATSGAKAESKNIQQIREVAEKMLGLPSAGESDLEVVRESLCFRPITSSGKPIIGRVPDSKLGDIKTRIGAEGGVFIAAGHGAWGISQSLGTGQVVAELAEGREASCDISRLGVEVSTKGQHHRHAHAGS